MSDNVLDLCKRIEYAPGERVWNGERVAGERVWNGARSSRRAERATADEERREIAELERAEVRAERLFVAGGLAALGLAFVIGATLGATWVANGGLSGFVNAVWFVNAVGDVG